jgi:hypothetical protein
VLQVLGERGYKKLFLWSDDTQDASGASIGAQQGVMDGVINSYPEPHMVLQHSVLDTSKSSRARPGRPGQAGLGDHMITTQGTEEEQDIADD